VAAVATGFSSTGLSPLMYEPSRISAMVMPTRIAMTWEKC
jgi:hypothetical protein